MSENSQNSNLTRRQLLTLLGLGSVTGLSTSLLTGCAVDPVTGKQQFVMMSEQEEIRLDQQQSPYQFSSDYGTLQSQQINDYVSRVGMELATRSHRPHMPFSFRTVNATYINAYAFPGGSIAVTRGILVELENEAELAALLGHEIGHVNARHTAERSSKGMLTSVLLAGATIATSAAGYGGTASLMQEFGQLGAGALLAHYSRDNEREADSLGMEYMTRAGYNPSGMVGLMDILLQKNQRDPSALELMFSTHPMSKERYTTAQQRAASDYAAMLASGPTNRERYLDMTAPVRRQKDAILTLQKGSELLAKNKLSEAETMIGQALTKMPGDYTANVLMAKCQFAQKNTSKAAQYASKATQIYPQEAQGHIVLGVSDIANKNYGQALNSFDQFDKLLPGNPEVTFFKGVSFEGMGQKENAAQQYNAYLQKVRKGDRAQYAYSKLKSWGYLR